MLLALTFALAGVIPETVAYWIVMADMEAAPAMTSVKLLLLLAGGLMLLLPAEMNRFTAAAIGATTSAGLTLVGWSLASAFGRNLYVEAVNFLG